ncbi:MAG: DegT/DnrJ/EryC1/StrS family aminotransferase [Pseudomonadota bacterium]
MTDNIPLVNLGAQYQSIKEEILAAVEDVMENSQFILGPKVAAFEAAFQEFCQGTNPAVAVNSGTSALHLALLAAGIGEGDEVITTPMTFIATASAIRYTGAKPVFVDIDPQDWTINPENIEAAITPKTKALMPVHIHGRVCDMRAIQEIADRHDLIVIEDAAQAHGGEFQGQRAGSMGDFSGFSFYAGKNLGAYGEGGAAFAKDPEHHKTLRMLRDWGSEEKYVHKLLGYNYRMEGIQGAVLGVKMQYIEEWTTKRGQHANSYSSLLKESGLTLPAEVRNGDRHAWHIYAVLVENRDMVLGKLHEAKIGAGIHYPIPLHLQPCFSDLGYKQGDFPITEHVMARCLSLPLFPELTAENIEYTSHKLIEITR